MTEKLFEAVCPEGCGAGSSIVLDVDGASYEVTVPAGVDAGDSFHVSIAIPDEEGGAPEPQPKGPVQRQPSAALRALQTCREDAHEVVPKTLPCRR